MASIGIRLSTRQIDDLRVIATLGKEKLRRIIVEVSTNPPTIRSDKILSAITSVVGSADASAVRRVLFGLATAARRRAAEISDILDGVTETLRSRWITGSDFEHWTSCRDAVEGLLRTESVVLATKAADLSSDFERYCLTSRMTTDIRPVFNEPRSAIVGAILVHTLRMEYMTPEGEQHSVSIVMDMDDVKKLQEACTQTIGKAEVAKKQTAQVWPETWQPGEEWTS